MPELRSPGRSCPSLRVLFLFLPLCFLFLGVFFPAPPPSHAPAPLPSQLHPLVPRPERTLGAPLSAFGMGDWQFIQQDVTRGVLVPGGKELE